MNYFNQFNDSLTTFHFGIVEYDDQFYCVVRDPLIDEPFSNTNKLLKRNAVRELVELNNDRAVFELNKLRAIFADLANYKVGTNDVKAAFGRFLALSNHHNIITKFGDSNGPINENWPLGLYTIVGNLRKELDDEIWVRQQMIEDLMGSYEKVVNMDVSVMSGLTASSKWERNGITNLRPDDEIDWEQWLEINKNDTYKFNKSEKLILSNDQTETITTAIDHDNEYNEEKSFEKDILSSNQIEPMIAVKADDNHYNEEKSFEKDILNDKGRSIYPALLDKYKGKNYKPAIMGAMLIALGDHGCLNSDPTLYSPRRVLVEAITKTFGTNHNGNEYSVSSFDNPLTGDDPKDNRSYHKRIIGEMLEKL